MASLLSPSLLRSPLGFVYRLSIMIFILIPAVIPHSRDTTTWRTASYYFSLSYSLLVARDLAVHFLVQRHAELLLGRRYSVSVFIIFSIFIKSDGIAPAVSVIAGIVSVSVVEVHFSRERPVFIR